MLQVALFLTVFDKLFAINYYIYLYDHEKFYVSFLSITLKFRHNFVLCHHFTGRLPPFNSFNSSATFQDNFMKDNA